MKALFSAAAVCLAAAGLVSAEGRVRVVHASPDAPKVDIRVDGQPALDAIPFGASTGYVPVPDGPHTFAIYVAGTDTLVTSVEATIAPNAWYTVAAVGFAGGQNPGFRVILLPDNRDEPPPGSGYIRFVHASPSTPPVDIYAGVAGQYETVQGRMPLLANFPFGVATGYLRVPAGTYYARVTPAGSKTVALDSGAVMLPSQGVRTAFALDNGVLLLVD